MLHDPRYLCDLLSIDTINFKAVDLSLALDTHVAPYLRLIIQEAAGLPLDLTFVDQKRFCSDAEACPIPVAREPKRGASTVC
jgi:hypothetical protein